MKTYGPYTPVKRAGNTYYVSGQIGVSAATKQAAKDIQTQTHQVLKNMRTCLAANNLGLNDVVKITIYVTDITTFSEVNNVYETYFDAPRPARACVQVADLPHVANAPLLVEMDAVAYKDDSQDG